MLLKTFNKFKKFPPIRSISFSAVQQQQQMDLKQVVKRLEQYASLQLAGTWDNVGLLLEPSEPLAVQKVFVTNDLTEPVLDEAIAGHANLIVSYHPPIFAKLNRITQCDWKQRIVSKCLEHRIAIYSPHTSWDAVNGGVNDWILRAFDSLVERVEPVSPLLESSVPSGPGLAKTVTINVESGAAKDQLLSQVMAGQCVRDGGVRLLSEQSVTGGKDGTIKQIQLEFLASARGVADLVELLKPSYGPTGNSSVLSSMRIVDLAKPQMSTAGNGRLAFLSEPTKIQECVDRLKKHFGMKHLRLGLANGKTMQDKVSCVGVCAGSGSSVLANNRKADLLVTGEFGHHEVLHENHRGVSCILTDHSNCERGHHPYFAERFSKLLAANNETVEIVVSKVDRDPLEIV